MLNHLKTSAIVSGIVPAVDAIHTTLVEHGVTIPEKVVESIADIWSRLKEALKLIEQTNQFIYWSSKAPTANVGTACESFWQMSGPQNVASAEWDTKMKENRAASDKKLKEEKEEKAEKEKEKNGGGGDGAGNGAGCGGNRNQRRNGQQNQAWGGAQQQQQGWGPQQNQGWGPPQQNQWNAPPPGPPPNQWQMQQQQAQAQGQFRQQQPPQQNAHQPSIQRPSSGAATALLSALRPLLAACLRQPLATGPPQ